MIPKRRMFYASLVSAAVFMTICTFAGYREAQIPYSNPDGTPDNAPLRAFGMLMIISPFLFVLVTGAFFAGGLILDALNRLKPKVVVATVFAFSIATAFIMAIGRPFGWRDKLHYFSGFTGVLLAVLVPSTLVWWLVAMRPNKSLERTRDG